VPVNSSSRPGRRSKRDILKKRQTQEPAEDSQALVIEEKEKQQVEARVAIGVNVVYEAIRLEGDDELRRPAAALA
jgi:hypothetical protein